MRWARVSLCTLAVSTLFLLDARPAPSAAPDPAPDPALSLGFQTPWVTPAAPWFSLSVAVGSDTGPVGDLHVGLTFYSRVNDSSELAQSINATPDKSVLTHLNLPI